MLGGSADGSGTPIAVPVARASAAGQHRAPAAKRALVARCAA